MDAYCLKLYTSKLVDEKIVLPEPMSMAAAVQATLIRMGDDGPKGSAVDIETPGFTSWLDENN